MKMAMAAFVIALLVTALLGMPVIRFLKKLKFGQKILEDGPTWHMKKQYTPTMGGILFIAGLLCALAVCLPAIRQQGDWKPVILFVFSLVFGLIGMIDDYTKIKKKQNQGLTPLQKLLLQIAAAALFVTILRTMGHLTGQVYVPFLDVTFTFAWWIYLPCAIFVIVGTVNAVNLTDGIDGLAASVTAVVAAFFTALFLGGAVCGMAFACDLPLILVPVGLIYIVETLSDIIQVTYFKLTHGKRIFKMAPLHHHFEMCGWSEKKIVFVFSAITAVMCVISYFGVQPFLA